MAIDDVSLIFVLMVFIAIFLLTQGLAVRSSDQKAIKRMRGRVRQIAELYERTEDSSAASLLYERYRRERSWLERWLESLPGVAALQRLITQSGHTASRSILRFVLGSVPRFLLWSLGLMAGAATIGWWRSGGDMLLATLSGLLGAALPAILLSRERAKHLATFEEQLPEALEIVIRALRAGYPFNQTLNLVAEEMESPIREEFAAAFADINFGMDVRVAFLKLLDRMPSISLLALVTAVLIQRETGGNLTEVLEKIAKVIRGRFHFQRRVLTLSAEARVSAWVLVLIPFFMFMVISWTTPDYLAILTYEPAGRRLLGIAFAMVVIGILWIRKLIKNVMEI